MEHVTLKHVAKVSGFSVTTVSRVLGGTDYPISAEARDAITKAAKDLGYIYVDTGAMYRSVTLYALHHGMFAADNTIDTEYAGPRS
jgi:DNA-binding LacI/PurR family transcriptional regulator